MTKLKTLVKHKEAVAVQTPSRVFVCHDWGAEDTPWTGEGFRSSLTHTTK